MKKLVLAGFVAAALGGGTGAHAMTLGDLLSGHTAPRSQIVQVQATSPEIQVQQLQDTVRQLTGRIEDLNFQIMQTQEQLRKAQEDNEFRFDQLEKKAGAKKSGSLETPVGGANQEAASAAASQPAGNQPTDQAAQAGSPPSQPDASQQAAATAQTPRSSDPVANTIVDATSTGSSTIIGDGVGSDTLSTQNQAAAGSGGNGLPTSSETANIKPGTLGSLIFGGDGNVVETTRNPEDNSAKTLPDVGGRPADAQKPMEQASIAPNSTRPSSSAEGSYQSAYKSILSGDYPMAEKGFRDYLTQYPESEKSSDASFWLGEAQYSQGHYNDAAKTFLNAYKAYGQSQKAPEMLLKLGMSLAALDNKDTACATFREIPKRFPKASKTVISRVSTEQSRLSCSST